MIALYIVLGIIAIPFVLGLFCKTDLVVFREVNIKKNKSDIFNFIKFVKNHDAFSVWNQMDPDMKKDHRGADGTVGFVYSWESLKNKNVGKGEQEISKIIEGELLQCDLRFEKPMKNIAVSKVITESVSANETKVKWTFESKMKYPMNCMQLFMNFDKILGKDLQALDNLKKLMEK